MLTTQQVANELGAAYSTVMHWLRQGMFPGAQQVEESRGPVWYIPAADVENFERPQQGRPRKPESELKYPRQNRRGGKKKPSEN